MASNRTPPSRTSVSQGLGALLAIVAFVSSLLLSVRLAGHVTSGLLGRFDMLDVGSYYVGREQVHLIAEPAFWTLTVLFALPALVTTALVGPIDWARPTPASLLERLRTGTLLALTALCSYGVMAFAFDPSRSGGHTPLVQREEQFSYEAADLVFAATWTMLATLAVIGASRVVTIRSAAVRAGVGLVAVAAFGLLFGTLFR